MKHRDSIGEGDKPFCQVGNCPEESLNKTNVRYEEREPTIGEIDEK